jgi:hypothetical protein
MMTARALRYMAGFGVVVGLCSGCAMPEATSAPATATGAPLFTPSAAGASPTAVPTSAPPSQAAPDVTAAAAPTAALHDLIRVTEPAMESSVASPIRVTGEARGTWFFEANFPIRLEGEDGATIAASFATALGEWMTEDYVEFEATVAYPPPAKGTRARLVLMRANPSGLAENDAELVIPVTLD